MPAPQATLMKTIIEGVLAGALPWGLVLSGAGLAIMALLCSISPLAFAIGVYLAARHDGGDFPGWVYARGERARVALNTTTPEKSMRGSSRHQVWLRAKDWPAWWSPVLSPRRPFRERSDGTTPRRRR